MSLKLIFKIQLASDYHIGAGFGLGATVDSALLRDADGVPVIRGTTLAGLLRDGLWRLLQEKPFRHRRGCKQSGKPGAKNEYCGQGDSTDDVDLCPLCRLFGTPRHPKRWFIGSARPEGKLLPTSNHQDVKRIIVKRARISPRTRRAEARKLFSQESGSCKQTFVFTATCPTAGSLSLDEAALLVAAARNVRHLGRGRNRGQGSCLFLLDSLDGTEIEQENWQKYLLEKHFKDKWLSEEPLAPSMPSVGNIPSLKRGEDNAEPIRVRLLVRTDEPLLIARKAEAGNQFETRNAISGQTLRGALAWMAARRYQLHPDEPGYEHFVHLFLRDQVIIPTLYPAKPVRGSNLHMTCPTPYDLVTCKVAPGTNGHGVWLLTQDQVHQKCPTCEGPLRNFTNYILLRKDYWIGPGKIEYEPTSTSEMHIEIDPVTGRVKEGQLYGYVALDAAQFFVGELLFHNNEAWSTFRKLTGIEPLQAIDLRIGKAHRRGYGKVTAWFEEIKDPDFPHPGRITPLRERIRDKKSLTLTLLSDMIILDAWGRNPTGFDLSWMQADDLFGKNLIAIQRASAATRLVDGFNAYLGLPRWRDLALTAGSTVKLLFKEDADLEHLEELERKGIGLRRSEGFGQVAFNHPVHNRCEGITFSLEIPDELKLKDYSDERAQFERKWARELDGENWATCKDARFVAVARWLQNSQERRPADLKKDLVLLGEPGRALINAIPEPGDRSKENKLQAKREGIELIDKLLGSLAQMDEAYWPAGLEMLADRIGGAAAPRA
jgi:CRISPR-associated protein Csx10